MSLLRHVKSGRQPAPHRIMIYGTHGIGKSTFASQAPKPIFIQTEDGLGEIDCDRFPLAESFDTIIEQLAALYTDKHDYQMVVIDSLDWVEQLVWAKVCKTHDVDHVEEIGYAKGYKFAVTHWRRLLDGLTALRTKRKMGCILIAHSDVERFEDPETDSYDRYSPRLHEKASSLVQDWCDAVLFAHYKVMTRTKKEEFGRETTKGVGTGERILRTQERPAYIAKNRFGLPPEVPLSWAAYANGISTAETKKKETSTDG